MGTFTLKVARESGDSIELKFAEDASIEDMKDVFTTVLTWMTFHHNTIKDIFPDEE